MMIIGLGYMSSAIQVTMTSLVSGLILECDNRKTLSGAEKKF